MPFLEHKNILIISPESWGKSYLSKHSYALELLKYDNRVWFLNSPRYGSDSEASQIESIHPGLKILDEPLVRGLRWLPEWLQRRIIRRQVEELYKCAGTHFDVVWSFDNSRYFRLDTFLNAYRIHQVMDVHMNYHLEAACQSAHLCLGVTDEIVREQRSFNTASHLIPHAFLPFAHTGAQLSPSGSRIKAVYAGNLLLAGFDTLLIERLAHEFSEVDFHLIGSYSAGNLNIRPAKSRMDAIQALSGLQNIFVHGEQSYADTFSMADDGDILLLTYFDDVTTNSLKVLPYLSLGKVVISSYLKAWFDSPFLLMAGSRLDFIERFREVVKDLSRWNAPELQQQRKEFANSNTYERRIQEIDQLIMDQTK